MSAAVEDYHFPLNAPLTRMFHDLFHLHNDPFAYLFVGFASMNRAQKALEKWLEVNAEAQATGIASNISIYLVWALINDHTTLKRLQQCWSLTWDNAGDWIDSDWAKHIGEVLDWVLPATDTEPVVSCFGRSTTVAFAKALLATRAADATTSEEVAEFLPSVDSEVLHDNCFESLGCNDSLGGFVGAAAAFLGERKLAIQHARCTLGRHTHPLRQCQAHMALSPALLRCFDESA